VRADAVVERVLADGRVAGGRERTELQQAADFVPGQAVLAGPADMYANLGMRCQLDLAGYPQRRGGSEQLRGVGAVREHLRAELVRHLRHRGGRGLG
jgi:hypothetical protein